MNTTEVNELANQLVSMMDVDRAIEAIFTMTAIFTIQDDVEAVTRLAAVREAIINNHSSK